MSDEHGLQEGAGGEATRKTSTIGKRETALGCTVLAALALGVGACALDKLRGFGKTVKDFQGTIADVREPHTEEISEKGYKLYTWKYSMKYPVVLFAKPDSGEVFEMNIVVNVGNPVSRTFGLAYASGLMGVACNTEFDGDKFRKWIVDNAANQGARARFGPVVVRIKKVVKDAGSHLVLVNMG